MPDNINLDSSGLQLSTCSAVLGWWDKVYSHSTTSLKTQIKRSLTKACLVLSSFFLCHWRWTDMLGSFSSGACTKFFKTNTCHWSYHRVNSLYNGTINCFSTLAKSSTASNETFNYKQALQEPDYHEFVNAMVNKVDDHESWVHWSLAKRCDLPPETKTIMSIWSFKRKQYPDGTLNEHKARFVLSWKQARIT